MAIVSKTNRKGVDKAIHVIQERTYANLLGFWVDGTSYTMYPRANKNYKNGSTIPEISLDSKDYKETLYDDNVAINSFFLCDDQSTYQNENNQIVQDVSIIFQADLKKLYGDAERLDEVFNTDVLQVFKDVKRFIYSDIVRVTGLDNVYSDLSLTSELKEKIQFSDISNRHILKLDFSIRYDFNCDSVVVPLCVPVTIMENGVLVARQPSGSTYSYSTSAADANIQFQGSPTVPVVSGGTLDIQVVDSLDAPIGALTTDSGTIKKVVVTYPTCANGNITVNSTAFGTVASGGTADVPVQYENGTPVGSVVGSVVEIPDPIAPVTPLNTADIFKTGATALRTGDDGNLAFGRGVDFVTLDFNNGFGDTNRFTDSLGTQIYASDEVVDWSTWNQVAETVLVYYRVPNSNANLTTQLAGQPYTKAGKSDWYICNYKQMNNIQNLGITRDFFNYAPLNIAYLTTADRMWSSSSDSATVGLYFLNTGTSLASQGSSYKAVVCRTFTLAELGL